VAEFEQTLSELRRPLNVQDLHLTPEDHLRMQRSERLMRYLRVDALAPRLRGATKQEVIVELVGLAAAAGRVSDTATALAAVLKREEAMSTGLRHGLACPHGRTDAVDRLVVAVGLKPEGLPFDSLDGLPATVVMLVLSPTAAVAPYMEFMAMMRGVLDPEGREALLRCDTPQAMYAQLTGRRPA
jgi:mannitol/fructose-specific phosphotransferase system IIA component (Ntr-type)